MHQIISINRSRERQSTLFNARRQMNMAKKLEHDIGIMRELERELVLTEIETFHLSEQIKIFVDAMNDYRNQAMKMRASV